MTGKQVSDWTYIVPQAIQLANFNTDEFILDPESLNDDAVSACGVPTHNRTLRNDCTLANILFIGGSVRPIRRSWNLCSVRGYWTNPRNRTQGRRVSHKDL